MYLICVPSLSQNSMIAHYVTQMIQSAYQYGCNGVISLSSQTPIEWSYGTIMLSHSCIRSRVWALRLEVNDLSYIRFFFRPSTGWCITVWSHIRQTEEQILLEEYEGKLVQASLNKDNLIMAYKWVCPIILEFPGTLISGNDGIWVFFMGIPGVLLTCLAILVIINDVTWSPYSI